MAVVVTYYSKTGNTKRIAETIAEQYDTSTFPLNVMKKGRRNKTQLLEEQRLFDKAIEYANTADLVFIGTPTEFRKPHPRIMEFLEQIRPRMAALFCTYYGMLGATMIDMETYLNRRGIPVADILALRVGKQKYTFRQDISQYKESITDEHLLMSSEFARKTRQGTLSREICLKGICGKDCMECIKYIEKKCHGSGFECWSGAHCQCFKCCVHQKSFTSCNQCEGISSCNIRDISMNQGINY